MIHYFTQNIFKRRTQAALMVITVMFAFLFFGSRSAQAEEGETCFAKLAIREQKSIGGTISFSIVNSTNILYPKDEYLIDHLIHPYLLDEADYILQTYATNTSSVPINQYALVSSRFDVVFDASNPSGRIIEHNDGVINAFIPASTNATIVKIRNGASLSNLTVPLAVLRCDDNATLLDAEATLSLVTIATPKIVSINTKVPALTTSTNTNKISPPQPSNIPTIKSIVPVTARVGDVIKVYVDYLSLTSNNIAVRSKKGGSVNFTSPAYRDTNGWYIKFTVKSLPPGNYTISVDNDSYGFSTQTKSIKIISGTTQVPSVSPVTSSTKNPTNLIASVFYAIGDLLDGIFKK